MKKSILKYFYLVLFSFQFLNINCQLPSSNVYLFDFKVVENEFVINNAKFLTAFNSEGYNNQASFINDQSFLLTSNHYNESQTDIIKLNLAKKSIQRITKTEESEYSPIFNSRLSAMSTVRVEKDESQRLHIYKTNGYNQGYRVLEKIDNIGYHIWDKKGNIFLYLVQEDGSSKLVVANPKTETVIPIIDNIGRCLKIGTNGELYFVHKISDQSWQIKSYNVEENKLTSHIRALNGKEDFEMIGNQIISGSGSLLYQYTIGLDQDWSKFCDFSSFGIKNITRLNIRNTKMLLVDQSAR